MTIIRDPKFNNAVKSTQTTPAQPKSEPKTNEDKLQATNQAQAFATPGRDKIHPSRSAPGSQPALFEKEIEKLRAIVRHNFSQRENAAKQALALCMAYTLRRSRGARRRALEVCDEISEMIESLSEFSKTLKEILIAEGYINDLNEDATLFACIKLIDLIEQAQSSKLPKKLRAFAQATLANGLIQLHVHFPHASKRLQVESEDLYLRALHLAETAIVFAPDLVDGFTALARVLLCHHEPDAAADVQELLTHALRLDPEYDPAEVAQSIIWREQGEFEKALHLVESVIQKGNAQVQPLLLKALLFFDLNQFEAAKKHVDEVLRRAPHVALYYLDAALIHEKLGEQNKVEQIVNQAQKLLGKDYDRFRQALSERQTTK